MNPIQKLLTGIVTLATLASPMKAGDEWKNIIPSYNPDQERTAVRFQRGTDNTYGFLDLFGNTKGNLETHYGEFSARKTLGKDLKVGVEYNTGSDMEDIVRPHVAYSGNIGPAYVDVKFSPWESVQGAQQLGLFGSVNVAGFGLEGWLDLDRINGEVTHMGEVEVSRPIKKGLSAILRAETFPWQESPSVSAGIKYDF